MKLWLVYVNTDLNETWTALVQADTANEACKLGERAVIIEWTDGTDEVVNVSCEPLTFDENGVYLMD